MVVLLPLMSLRCWETGAAIATSIGTSDGIFHGGPQCRASNAMILTVGTSPRYLSLRRLRGSALSMGSSCTGRLVELFQNASPSLAFLTSLTLQQLLNKAPPPSANNGFGWAAARFFDPAHRLRFLKHSSDGWVSLAHTSCQRHCVLKARQV